MNPQITSARKHQNSLRRGIPTNAEAQDYRETEVLLAEIIILTEALDRLLLETDCHHVSSCVIWGVEVRLLRLSGVSYRLITENAVWKSITELACEASEYALQKGFIRLQ